ncbi:hypothetical protein MesoLjLa_66770 (plasmid) [Mesorhizobium sp. L-2-11]|nr:hypothetical protein MesoLjLa_66770 [Mesorhizobium sp. L-2-11]
MLASAIAAHLAKVRTLEDGVRGGKLFVFEKLQKKNRTTMNAVSVNLIAAAEQSLCPRFCR